MSGTVFLDSRPIGLITQRQGQSLLVDACRQWYEDLNANGWDVYLPEITDYELRRELLRADKAAGLLALDRTKITLGYVPITTAAMQRAAEFWAQARRMRLPTAPDLALDAGMILAAQAATLNPEVWGLPDADVIIATSNVGHLSRFADAREWPDIV